MTRHLEAIYQGGVLRPLQPLDLDENQAILFAKDQVDLASFGAEVCQQKLKTAFLQMFARGLLACAARGEVFWQPLGQPVQNAVEPGLHAPSRKLN